MTSHADVPARAWRYDILRVVSILGVLAIHVFGNVIINGVPRSNGWWFAVIADIGAVWAVPVFVMLSGALILAPRQFRDGVSSFYRRRLARLAPAFVFWQLFYIVVFQVLVSNVPAGRILTSIVDGKSYTHLYFLWLIVGLYAVAPVLAAFLSQGGQRRAVAFAGVILLVTVLASSSSALLAAIGQPRPLTLLAVTQWVPYVGFFLAGWALRSVILRGWQLGVAMFVTLTLLALTIVQYGLGSELRLLNALFPVSYYGPTVSLVAIGVFVVSNSLFAGVDFKGAGATVVKTLSDACFGVFLVHFAVMLFVRQIPIFSEHAASAWLAAAQWVVVVVVSFALVILGRRIPLMRRIL